MSNSGIDTRRAVESILRLRRVTRLGDEETNRDVEPVLSYLEEIVGSTVKRAEAARLLGISHTALDRWVEKGDIPAVLTPSGRREIPLSQVVDLLEQLGEQANDRPLALAKIIRDRRRDAAAIPEDEFLPPRLHAPRTHKVAELHALAYHRLVARRLDRKLVDDARKRLTRWEQTGRIDPRWAEGWERILAMPAARIAQAITADSERGRALRQTSPFAGALNEQERQRVVRAVEERAAG
jgi:excisionase family DNA binding protein